MFTKFGLSPLVVLPILGAMLALRWLRVGMLTWVLAWWAALWAGIVFGFVTPVPASVVKLYMSIVTLALFAYVTSSEERRTAFAAPIVALVTRRERRLALLALMAAVRPLIQRNGVADAHQRDFRDVAHG